MGARSRRPAGHPSPAPGPRVGEDHPKGRRRGPAGRLPHTHPPSTGADNRPNYSGKHKCHGLLVIALTDDRGRLVWISAVRPGRTSEITACRHDKLTAHLRAAGLGAIADLGFIGLDDGPPDADPAVITGYKAARNRPLTRGQKLSNKALAAVRAPVEHGFAHLKNWRVLGKVRTDPRWATTLVRALLVLTNRQVAR
ncbi:transposase family protein [Streptomyces ferralitis]|uniref:Transposase family protein n=1 Tax=Streptantibioticus ferralitis TaxID=236510 RepID=A0ABT5Z5W0_9ACTN|nr:transposase family protein [Streptantibioticus ferralitis]